MKERAFKKLAKTSISHLRVDKFGKHISFYEYGMKTKYGWLIDDDGDAVAIGTIRIEMSWEK